MSYHLRVWPVLLLLGLALFANPARGQSLSIVRKGESEVFTLFSVGDFTDLPLLAGKLKDPARPFDGWLAAALSGGTKAALASYQGPASDPGPLQTTLVRDLNGLLSGTSLYEPQRFAGINLRPETAALLSTSLQGDNLLRLNRRLLEDAYPVGLARNQSEFWIEAAAPSDTRYLLQASEDLLDWMDLNDEVWGQLSYQIDNAALAKRFFRLTPWTPLVPVIVVLLGDSTVSDFMGFYGTGWGRGIYDDFTPDARVVNLAWPGLSTRVYLASEQHAKLVVIRPDFVLVQFGHADVYGCTGGQCTTTLPEYADNLRTIVRAIRGFNGTPILITPPAQRTFGADGKVLPIYAERSAAVRDVAAELQTPLIDLNRLSTDLFNQLGESESAYISMGTDLDHFSPEGAEVIAGLVVKALPNSLRRYLVR